MALVCGIDPSLTSAGVAILRDGKPVHTSNPGFTDTGGGYSSKNYCTRNRRGRYQAMQIYRAAITCGTPDLILIEEHPYGAESFGSEFDRVFLWGKVYENFDVHDFPTGLPIAVVPTATLKVWVTGKGATRDPALTKYQRQKLNKQRMVDAVNSWWPGVTTNDDIADALGLAAIGAFHLGDEMPFTVKERHTTGLEKVAWP